ncbi:hypothetical protein HQ545_03525 [Candidatus Woesearchaeota archaeon]|nr:hypothetical protein [Candidatus Woesearchaeota archaeon]
MVFTEDEKKILKLLVRKEIDEFTKEGKTLIVDDNPSFLAVEEKYEQFLERLLNKL